MRKRKTKNTLHNLLKKAPITQKLSGLLSKNVSLKDYKKYLEKKYLKTS